MSRGSWPCPVLTRGSWALPWVSLTLTILNPGQALYRGIPISGILWNKIWKTVPGTGTSMCTLLGCDEMEAFQGLQVSV